MQNTLTIQRPEGRTSTGLVQDPEADARYRHATREAAVLALMALDPQDAAVICGTVLDEIGALPPRLDFWTDIHAAAQEWAFKATAPELEVYFASALKRLENQALGLRARKRMLCALFASLSAVDQAAFLQWTRGAA